jgi:hypothetical protein
VIVKNILDFFNITDKTIWQDVLLSSIIIPFVFVIFSKIKNWYSKSRPLRMLLNGYAENESDVLIYLSQLTALNSTNQKNNDQKYAAFYPSSLPTYKNNILGNIYQNIDPVWSESDGRCVADVFNTLGRVGKARNVRIADTLNDWSKHENPIFTVGFNPKTKDILSECEPVNFAGYDLGYLKIDGHDLKLDSVYPSDAGVIQKTFIKGTCAPVFILAGLGTLGTEVQGYVLSQKCVELGKLYGRKSFCVLVKTDFKKGRGYQEIKAVYPGPSRWRAVFYPVTYYRWTKKNIFPSRR